MAVNNGREGDNEELDLTLPEDAFSELEGSKQMEEATEEEVEEGAEEKVEGAGVGAIEEIEEKKEEEGGEEAVAKAYAELLLKEGILDDIEGVKSFEDILSRERAKGDKVIEEFIAELPIELAEQIKAHSKGLDVEEIKGTIGEIAKLEGYKDTVIKGDKNIAEKLYRQLLEMEGEEADYIEEMVQLAKDSDTIGKQGIRAKNRLLDVHKKNIEAKEIEEAKRAEQIKKAQDEWMGTLNKTLDGDGMIWDIKLSNKDKKEVKSILFDAVEERVINGQKVAVTKLQKMIEEDPTTLVQIALGIQKGMFGKDGKLTVATTKAKNEVVKSLEDALKKKVNTSDNGTSGSKASVSYENSAKAIKGLFAGLKV